MKAALYVRVSTDRQDAANQRPELEQLAEARGWSPVWYAETVSGAARERPALARMMADARAGKVRVVAMWAMDRLHRSMQGAIETVLELDRLGVQVVSLREPWLDTAGPVRSLLVAIFGWVAEQERSRLIERTRAGLERARAKGTKSGKPIGRPRVSSVSLAHAVMLVQGGEKPRAAAKKAKVSPSTLYARLRALDPDGYYSSTARARRLGVDGDGLTLEPSKNPPPETA